MNRAILFALALTACQKSEQNTSSKLTKPEASAACAMSADRFGKGPLLASEPDAYKNVLAVGADGPSWNGTPVTWAEAGMYVDLVVQMDPRPTLHIKVDPKLSCEDIRLLRVAVEKHCNPHYCSLERTAVPPNGPRPLRA